MANSEIFSSHNSIAATDTINEAGGVAYSLDDRSALAQYIMTGVFSDTFYSQAKYQAKIIVELINKIDDHEFVGKLAVYGRKNGFMKDTPAFLLAWLASKSHKNAQKILRKTFPIVIDNGKMLRNFVQIIRSGVFGRKSLGSLPKKLIQNWFKNHDANYIFNNSIGKNPSLQDVIKLSHPNPNNLEKDALFGYLLDKDYKFNNLPSLVKEYITYKAGDTQNIPNIPFQFLSSLDLPEDAWKTIALNGGWHMVRMNLNTFARHNVYEDKNIVNAIADKLRDEDTIKKSKVFPYQLLTTFQNVKDIPSEITLALQDAMEIATQNVPVLSGNVFILPDTSGSMGSSVTGYRNGIESKTRCIDVAGLMASCILRNNPNAKVIPFAENVKHIALNSRDSVMTNAQRLANLGGGGTNCSAPLEEILKCKYDVDTIIYISDYESWMDADEKSFQNYYQTTSSMEIWNKIKKRNKNAKCVCIDVTPSTTTQLKTSKDILNIGGFSDQVFNVINGFVNNIDKTIVNIINDIEI